MTAAVRWAEEHPSGSPGTHPEQFMQPQCSRAEHKADQQQPEELVTEEL